MTGSKGSAAGDEQEQSPSSERNAEILKLLSTADLAAAFTVALAAAPEAAHASGNGCLVSAHAVGGFTEWLVAEDGTSLESDQGTLKCDNGVWTGPNADSPMPDGSGGIGGIAA
jgi:hypothetical protein